MVFEEFKKYYNTSNEELLDPNTKQMFEKYPDEILKLIYKDRTNKFEIDSFISKKVEILKNIKYEDIKLFLAKEFNIKFFYESLLIEESNFDVNLIMPMIKGQSNFFSELYDKYIKDAEKIEDITEKNSLLAKYLNEYSLYGNEPEINKGNLEKYLFLSKEVLKDLIKNKEGKEYKLVDLYGENLQKLTEKYGYDLLKEIYLEDSSIPIISQTENLKTVEDFENLFQTDVANSIKKRNVSIKLENLRIFYKNANEELIDQKTKQMFEKYPDEILKLIYKDRTNKFEIDSFISKKVEILKNIKYEDIKLFLAKEFNIKFFYESLLIEESNFDVNLIMPMIKGQSDFFSELCDKYIKDAEKIEDITEKNSLLAKYLNEYSTYGNEPEINKGNLEKYLFLSKEVLKDLIKNKESNEYKLVDLYGENLQKLTEKYGYDLLKEIYLENNSIPITNQKEFIEKHPEMFLLQDVPEDIKAKFYERKLKYSDFIEDGKVNEQLLQAFKNTHLYFGVEENLYKLFLNYCSQDADIENLNKIVLEVCKRIEELNKNQMSKETKNVVMDWVSKNIFDNEIENKIFSKKLRNLYVLTNHIILSNSSELRKFQDKILENLLTVEKPGKTLKNIEKGFLEKTKTVDERLFSCFTYLHPNLLNFCRSATSPIIKKYVKEGNEEKIRNLLKLDVLKSILGSNNKEMKNHLEKGEISSEMKELLEQMGLNSAQDALAYMNKAVEEAEQRNTEISKKGRIEIGKSDFLKGLGGNGINYIETILKNGSQCKEFLGDSAETDGTPLDTDISIIDDNGIKGTYSYGGWGPIYILIKNDKRFVDFREFNNKPQDIPEEQILKNRDKLEICDGLYEGTGGIRTAFPSTYIDAFMFEEGKYDKRLELEIVKNGFYIPICDVNQNILFTREMYEKLKTKMNGLSYYGRENEFEFGSKLINDDIIEIEKKLEESTKTNDFIKSQMYQAMEQAIEEYNLENGLNQKTALKLKNTLTSEIIENEVEILSTGSSERNTNIPGGKLDYDFVIKLDNKFLKSKAGEEQKAKIIRKICEKLKISYSLGDIKNVSVKVGENEVKSDFSFMGKTNKMEYSTEMCLSDRLESIKKLDLDKYRYVLANVILAKKVLKENGAYSKIDGGLGGVGIENWVLQHGGSFYDAVKDFLEVAKKCNNNFDEFKKQYSIWDFGKNHYAYRDEKGNFPHDDFIFKNLRADKFSLMVSSLEKYMKEHQFEEFKEEYRKEEIVNLDIFNITDIARQQEVAKEIGSEIPAKMVEELSKDEKEQENNDKLS